MGYKLKAFRTDRGGKYMSKHFESYLKTKGIHHKITMPNTPQHNGMAEWLNQTLMEKAHVVLSDAKLPESYWFDALEYAIILWNILPTQALTDMTPKEAWSGNKPDVLHLRIFGCQAFMHIPKESQGKLTSKSLLCTFLGYAHNHSAYHLICQPSHHLFESQDVIFDEFGQQHEHTIIDPNTGEGPTEPPPSTSCPKCAMHAPIKDDDPHYKVTSYGKQHAHANVAKADETNNPQTYAKAMRWTDVVQWEMACEQEKRAFKGMGVYSVVPRPQGCKVVGSKWVFHIKCGPDGTVQKYKARLVARGFTQIEGVDYNEMFAPVAKLTSLRMILTLSNEHDLEVHQMDIKSAYLNGALKEEIYMEPPLGFNLPDGMVLKLTKAVYGMKQGSRVWYKDIRETLRQMGYKHTKADHTVFTRADLSMSTIMLYVDDITMVSKDLQKINKDKEVLKRKYEMMDLSELNWILGICVMRDHRTGTIALSQKNFAKEILEWFKKTGLHPISTPALANEHMTKLTSPEVDPKGYQQAIGALMYLMIATWPDLAYVVGMLGCHTTTPREEHLRALNRVFRYLQGTKGHELMFRKGTMSTLMLKGYADADWASDRNDRKSTSRYSGLGKCCNVWQFWIIYSVVLYSVEITLSITERK
jgi:reverse transcriptase-like protein